MESKEKNTKEKILEEALKLFAQSGYMGTSICAAGDPLRQRPAGGGQGQAAADGSDPDGYSDAGYGRHPRL